MNNEFEQTLETVKHGLALSPLEKAQMRGALQAFIDEHPARAPFSIRFQAALASFSQRTARSRRLQSGALAAALILVLGTGTSYAAENSLPGQPLYPIKINVEEPIQGALAVTPQAKASWQTTLATKRLQEAETLAAQGKLTPSDTATIQTQLQNETQDFNADVSQLSRSQENDAQVAVVQSDMEAALSAHAQVLAALNASTTATSSRPGIAAILDTVRAHAATAMHGRIQAELALETSASSSVQKSAAETDATIAQAQLQSVRALIGKARPSHAATSTIEQALSAASSTQVAIDAADQNAHQGDYRKALNGFLNALRAAQETKIDVSAAVDLNTDVPVSVAPNATSTDVSDTEATSSADVSATSTLQNALGQ